MALDFPEKFLIFNTNQTKNLAVVVKIDGVDLLSNRPIYTRVRYGDPGIRYGQSGLVYGGLRRLENVRQLINWDQSNLSLAQRLEPEQGRGSVSMISLSFTDKDAYMTRVISPGVIVDEIMGRSVEVYIGYEEISYPEDYIKVFRGRITDVKAPPAQVNMQFSDPNFNRRQTAFITAKTKLAGNLLVGDTSIPVLDGVDFHKPILGPDGLYDVPNPWDQDGTYNTLAPRTTGVRTFLKIDDEWIEYGPLGVGTNLFLNVLRGARGTVAATHAIGADVMAGVEITDNCMELALKTQLSGWAGPWLSDVTVYSVMRTFDLALGDQPRAFILPGGVDAKRDYGLVDGDYITTSGFGVSGNNDTFRIVRFAELNEEPNRLVYVDKDLTPEYPTTGKMAFRSQYDTYPSTCGVKLTPQDVDADAHVTLRDNFLSGQENSYRFFLTSEETVKSFIETEIYLPVSAYSLTVRGKLSVGYHIPPLGNTQLVFLTKDNIKNPEMIQPQRGLNNRKFFNELDIDYDFDDTGQPVSFFRAVDADSLSRYKVSSTLPVRSRGTRTDLGSPNEFTRRARRFFSRYSNAATIIECKVNWGTGIQIEAGQTVALKDEGDLKISNFATGERNLGTQLFEVLDRDLNIKGGDVPLKLISGLRYDVNDRFAVISPSSEVDSGSESYLILRDSFGAQFPGDEMRKWRNLVGQKIVMHDENYTYYQETTLLRLDAVNNYKMYITGFSVAPPYFTDMIIDIPRYPHNASKTQGALYKQIFAHFGPYVQIVSGASPTQFDVGAGDAPDFFIGAKIRVHKEDYSTASSEVTVIAVLGTTITVSAALGFTPDNTYFVTGIGFLDKQGSYRYI